MISGTDTDPVIADAGEPATLRDALESEFAKLESADAPTPDTPDTVESAAPDAPDTGDEPETDDPQSAAPESDDEPTEAPADDLKAPQSWTADERELWDTLDEGAKAAVSRVLREQQSDYTRKTQELAEQRKQYEQLEQVLAPHRERWTGQGIGDAQVVATLVNSYSYLQQNPAEGIRQLTSSFGLQPEQVFPDSTSSETYQDPDTQALRQEINALKAQITQTQTYTASAQQQQIDASIAQFRDAKNATGQPEHPHFAAVEPVMAKLIAGGVATGMADAYEQAVRLNPELSAPDNAAAAEKAAMQRALKARKAAKVNVESRKGAGAALTPADASKMTVREELAANFEALGGL